MSRADLYIPEAEKAAQILETSGQKLLARSVRGLIRSYGQSRSNNRTLHGENMKLRARLTPIGRARANEAAEIVKAETSRLLEPVAAGLAEHTWCDQCQRRVAPEEGRACDRSFCGVRPPRQGHGAQAAEGDSATRSAA